MEHSVGRTGWKNNAKLMRISLTLPRAAAIAAFVLTWPTIGTSAPDSGLTVIIVRHGEKPEKGDNLSCQGQNRALQLPSVLLKKFGKPDYTYVPALKLGESSKHARMFQTVTPFAIKENLKVNSAFDEADVSNVAKDVREREGTVLLVWEHSQIQKLAQDLGVSDSPKWQDDDFDSIWVITYENHKASLTRNKQGLNPSTECSF